MRKRIVSSLVVGLFLLSMMAMVIAPSVAGTDSATAPVYVDVSANSAQIIIPGGGSVLPAWDFGSMAAGEIKALETLDVTVGANATWNISVLGAGALTSGANTIPLANLRTKCDDAGSALTTYTSITTSAQNYFSGFQAIPAGSGGTVVDTDMQLSVPGNQAAGVDYTTTLTFTVTTS